MEVLIAARSRSWPSSSRSRTASRAFSRRGAARKRGEQQFDPALADILATDADAILDVSTQSRPGRGDRGRAGAGGRALERALRPALSGIATFVDLSRVHARSCPRGRRLAAQAGAQIGVSESAVRPAARRPRARPRTLGSRTRSGTSAPLGPRMSAYASTRISPSACCAVRVARAAGAIAVQQREHSTALAIRVRSRAPRSPAGADPRSPTPTRRCSSAPPGRPRSADEAAASCGRVKPAASTPRPSASSRRWPSGGAATRGTGAPHAPRDRGYAARQGCRARRPPDAS